MFLSLICVWEICFGRELLFTQSTCHEATDSWVSSWGSFFKAEGWDTQKQYPYLWPTISQFLMGLSFNKITQPPDITPLRTICNYRPLWGTWTWIIVHLRDSFIFFLNEFIYLFIYLFMAVLGFRCCRRSLVVASGGYFSLRCAGLSLQWPLVAEHRL